MNFAPYTRWSKGVYKFACYVCIVVDLEKRRGEEMRLDVRAHRCEICKIVSAGKKEGRKEGKMFQGKMAERNSENRKGGEQRVPPVNLFVT